jgi:hypothetical protein
MRRRLPSLHGPFLPLRKERKEKKEKKTLKKETCF